MYAGVIAATGWTWEYIDEYMTLGKIGALNHHWDIAPPVHISLARLNSALLKKETAAPTKEDQKKAGLKELINMFSQAGGKVK